MQVYRILRNTLFVSVLSCFAACKKDSSSVNIKLYDQPLSVKKKYVQGNWKLQYEKGGICAWCLNDFRNDNFIWNIQSNDSIKQTFNNQLLADTAIIWSKDKPVISTDSVYIMSFLDKRGLLNSLFPYEIKNDTLVMTDIGYDPVTYYFARY